MTYIRSVPQMADTDEVVSIHTQNAREWLKDAERQAYRNPTSIAFAVKELIEALETLAGAVLND